MAKLFAITLLLVAAGSALLLIHPWMPQDISATGAVIDRQMSSTILEAGLAFLVAQILLAAFIWKFSAMRANAEIKNFPGGARALVLAAIVLVGTEIAALAFFGQKSWAGMFLAPTPSNALTVQVQAEQFAYYFRYPGPDGKFGPIHPEKMDDSAQNFFGLDRAHDADSKDDIMSPVMAIPVGREIHLLMRSKDVGHSFYVPELRIQQDFVPGMDLSLHFTATKTGRYEIMCTQLCGLGHYRMRAHLEVMTQADFEQWLRSKAAAQ